jgi:hypothetical protein
MVVAFQRVNGTGVVPGRQFTGKATRLQKLPGGFSFRRTGRAMERRLPWSSWSWPL